jgi:hypothetical protein
MRLMHYHDLEDFASDVSDLGRFEFGPVSNLREPVPGMENEVSSRSYTCGKERSGKLTQQGFSQ